MKIQDGCNQFCSYCIIPYTRGRVRSRELLDIRREAQALANHGYQEIVLTGIHLDDRDRKSGSAGMPRLSLGSWLCGGHQKDPPWFFGAKDYD